MMNQKNTAAAVVALALAIPSAQAINITIGDGLGSGGSGVGREVGETEPNTQNTHQWDNEAFVIKGNKLVLVTGFNLLSGVTSGSQTFRAGDIFINTAGSTPAGTIFSGGNGYRTINGNAGYEFVLDLDIANNRFNVVNISGSGVQLSSGYYRQNDAGNPFAYLSGGVTGFANQALTYRSGLSTATVQSLYGADVTTSGENNYAIELDMSWWNTQFPSGNALLTHFTMGCDNDVIHGQASGGFDRLPEAGSTAMMLGLGMGGLALLRRRLTAKA